MLYIVSVMKNQNVQRWLKNPDYQNFIRQVHLDIYVGVKNGANYIEAKAALVELGQEIANSVDFNPQIPSKKV
jgi:hypothetical protein